MKRIKTATKSLFKVIFVGAMLAVISIISPELHRKYLYYKVGSVSFQPVGLTGGSGSSFLLTEGKDTYVITNYHVCNAFSYQENGKWLINLKVSFNPEVTEKREVIAMSIGHDLCAIKAKKGEKGLKLAGNVSIKETIHIVGHPLGYPIQMATGEIVSPYEALVAQMITLPEIGLQIPIPVLYKCILVHMHSGPGNSGSAVVDHFGNVVGVLFAGSSRNDFSGLIIPFYEVKDFLNKVKKFQAEKK